MDFPVIDLHCDLLGCIAERPDLLTFESEATNCSIPQLLTGGVRVQTFAIATVTTPTSTLLAKTQLELFETLQKNYSDKLTPLLGIENASGLLEEDEPLENAFSRLDQFSQKGSVLYLSLTWNHENRFGGGNATDIGLKPDGKSLLEYLDEKKIAIDLSHTSDPLAYQILDYIDKKSLSITPIASHSNFRKIHEEKRNLPDSLAKEIISRGGLIGINFIRRFVGDDPHDFIRHIEHALYLGGENTLCLGSDFYGGIDIPHHLMPERTFPTFQQDFNNASCYPRFFAFLEQTWGQKILEKLANQNAKRFFDTVGIS